MCRIPSTLPTKETQKNGSRHRTKKQNILSQAPKADTSRSILPVCSAPALSCRRTLWLMPLWTPVDMGLPSYASTFVIMSCSMQYLLEFASRTIQQVYTFYYTDTRYTKQSTPTHHYGRLKFHYTHIYNKKTIVDT